MTHLRPRVLAVSGAHAERGLEARVEVELLQDRVLAHQHCHVARDLAPRQLALHLGDLATITILDTAIMQ